MRVQQVQVRYFAGAAAATGVETEGLELPPGSDVEALRATLARRHPRLEPVLAVASLLVDEVAVNDPALVLDGARSVDVLPPFAGG